MKNNDGVDDDERTEVPIGPDDDGVGAGDDGRMVVNLDRSLIPQSQDRTLNKAITDDCELQALGIVSYQHSVYEQNVIDQVKKNLDDQLSPSTADGQTNDNHDETRQMSPPPAPVIADDDGCSEDDADVDRFLEAPGTCYLEEQIGRRRRSMASIIGARPRLPNQKERIVDDGDAKKYRRRVAKYRLMQAESGAGNDLETNLHRTEDGLSVPERIWQLLYGYQHESLRWLWQLHRNLCGGILGDEMGLGKTVQIIAFLVALSVTEYGDRSPAEYYPKLGPVLLVCPATVLYQWVYEFHKWWPPFRVAVLHQSGSYQGSPRSKLIAEVFRANGILLTTYNGLAAHHRQLVKLNWHYVILDEGHKIRNPDAQITHFCKLFETPHRLILSGTPIQNDLRELWSLMDFVYPSKLGTLPTFMANVAAPIRQGGYAHATEKEIQISYRCSVMLRDVIKPYLLRRTKDAIQNSLRLPAKNEQVLFCQLTEIQKRCYLDYINSSPFRRFDLEKSFVFKALINIRKICNHPYLFSKETSVPDGQPSFDKQFFHQSSKMVVVNALLKLWRKQCHKVLIFTQGRQMLDLLERWVQNKQYSYYRMDGTTAIGVRQQLIKSFNEDPERYLFLLTTRVGGVGVSLTGANRVIIFDPDWNPCTDIQARERCWRIGQRRDVIIYRLLTAGTVEEKIYHRQIFKQYLSNRILKDPAHKRFVKMNNLRELFTLNDTSETGLYFYDSKVRLNRPNRKRPPPPATDEQPVNGATLPKIPKRPSVPTTKSAASVKSGLIDWSNVEIKITDERRRELREQVKKICQSFDSNAAATTSDDAIPPVDNSCSNSTAVTAMTNYVIDNQPGTSGVKVKVLSSSAAAAKEDNSVTRGGGRFEGKRIKYLVRKEKYRPEDDDEEEEKDKNSQRRQHQKQEDYLLGKLLGNSQLETVLHHDRIENVTVPDHYHIDREAKEFATNAIRQLQEELRFRRQQPSNRSCSLPVSMGATVARSSPTTAITAAGDGDDDGQPLSSASLMAGFKNRFRFQSKAATPKSAIEENRTVRQLENQEMMHELYDYLVRRTAENGGTGVHTGDIVREFRYRIRPEQTLMMKALLQHMAVKTATDQNTNGSRQNYYWRLRSDYQL